MPCSQFIVHEDEDKCDTLVIIVNGDGTVNVDRHILERVLKQQCRAAVSVIRIVEDCNEPDSQTEENNGEKDEKQTEGKEPFRHKVNLVVEGYYAPPPLNMRNKEHTSADSLVLSTISTPPSSQTTADLLHLLSEGLEMPASQSNLQTSTLRGNSLVNTFSEMSPSQLKQVETALHSENAEQILGNDATFVLDTLKMNVENGDWVHVDHCYSNICGAKKNNATSTKRIENVIIPDSGKASLLPIKVNSNNELLVHQQPKKNIDQRMSAIENSVAILDRIHMELERKNRERGKHTSLSDDERPLSGLSNDSDKSSKIEKETHMTTSASFKNVDLNSQFSSRKSNNKLENSFEDSIDYEDDADKLWCICNKPHGNRFMICCDTCDYWFHGSCVGVTRIMGEEMELNGTDWLCPSCRKEKFAKKQEQKSKLYTKEKFTNEQEKKTKLYARMPNGRFARRENRSSSSNISSSDTSPHQQGVKSSGDESDNLFIKEANVTRIEDESGNLITRDENVKNNAEKGSDVKMKGSRCHIKPIPIHSVLKQIDEPKSTSSAVTKPVTQKSVAEKDQKKKSEPSKNKSGAKKVKLKRQESKNNISEESGSNEPTSTIPTAADIRSGIRKALNELFISRSKGAIDVKTTEAELTTLAHQVEEELFNLFKNTGNKYKIKYRRLLFNIKDPKNSLFRRIVEKTLSPSELVIMTPEELASTELAQWREREAKLELERITKVELENLSHTEILTEEKNTNELKICSETLPTSTTDTVVSNVHLRLPMKKDRSVKLATMWLNKDKEKLSSRSCKGKELSKDEKTDQVKDKDRHKKHHHSERPKSDKHRPGSSEHDPHLNKSGSGSRVHHKSSEKDGFKISSEINSRRRNSEKNRSSRSSSEIDKLRGRSRRRSSRSRSQRTSKYKSSECKDEPQNIESALTVKQESTEVLKTSEKKKSPVLDSTVKRVKIDTDLSGSCNAMDVDLTNMMPTSTVTIKTPPPSPSPETSSYVWKGVLHVPGVTKFYTMLKEVSGNCEGLNGDLKGVISCIGRINPTTVWKYIARVKKSEDKELLVLRFAVHQEEQRMNYLSLYSYLSSKSRLVVVGNTGSNIKHFYIMPLARHKPVPQVLLPFNGPGFEDQRSNMLLGVIVRSLHQKLSSTNSPIHHSSTLLTKQVDPITCIQRPPNTGPTIIETDSFTPPHSPTSVSMNKSTSEWNISKNNEGETSSSKDDVPYSLDPSYNKYTNKSLNLQTEMEKISRKIRKTKQKIKIISSSLPRIKRGREPTTELNIRADSITGAYKKNVENRNDKKSTERPEPTNLPEISTLEVADEVKLLSRDPRIKLSVVTDNSQIPSLEPPPPGTEDEFVPPPGFSRLATTSESSVITKAVMDHVYSFSMQSAATYAYSVQAAATPYPPRIIPPHSQMYVTAAQGYPQTRTLPYTTIPPQMFILPPVHHHDPAIMPLAANFGDSTNPLKRKSIDDIDKEMDSDKSRSSRRSRSDSKERKNRGYHSDSKPRQSNSRSPRRRRSSSRDCSRRSSYQRDDVQYSIGGRNSRHDHKYRRNYRNQRDTFRKRGIFRKRGNGSSSDHSSGHKKYSDRSKRSSSRDKRSRRRR